MNSKKIVYCQQFIHGKLIANGRDQSGYTTVASSAIETVSADLGGACGCVPMPFDCDWHPSVAVLLVLAGRKPGVMVG